MSHPSPAEESAQQRQQRARQAFMGHEATTSRERLARELADEVRLIMERLVDTRAPEDKLGTMLGQLRELRTELTQFDYGRRYSGYSEASVAGSVYEPTGPPHGHSEYSPIIGQANPIAPPLRMADGSSADRAVGYVTFGSAYEGAPGSVHGGYVAAVLDEVMGAAQALTGQPGMTGTMTVKFRSPTPIRRELMVAATVGEVQGRKIFVTGTVHDGDRLCAECEAVFITVDFAKLAAMVVDRDKAAGDSDDG